MDVGILVLRLLVGALLLAHAAQKSFGWFSGRGATAMGEAFHGLGLRPGKPMVILASITETVAAVLLILGLFTPLGAAIAAATMGVAGLTMHRAARKFWNAGGGGEYPYVLAVLALILGFTGAGAYSIDRALSSLSPALSFLSEPSIPIGIAVILIALIGVVPFAILLVRARREVPAKS